MASEPSRVVLIDDQDDTSKHFADALRDRGLDAIHRLPEDLTDKDLCHTQLILVDFQLHKGWPQGTASEKPAHRIVDGLALASVLRRIMASMDDDEREPTAIALLTSHLHEVLKPLPNEQRQHVVARFTNLEWAFNKGDPRLHEGVTELAAAVLGLPRDWGDDRDAPLLKLLGLQPDGEVAESDVKPSVWAALPPIHDIAEWSHGIAVLRWLLHRVLPYPTFLWNELRLAVQLQVDPAWLKSQLEGKLEPFFANASYRGVLSSFAGRRWWARAVHQILWEHTNGQPHSQVRLRDLLKEVTGEEPFMLSFADPVLALNTQLIPSTIISAADAERLQPDDWPPYADAAWASAAAIETEPRLRALRVKEWT